MLNWKAKGFTGNEFTATKTKEKGENKIIRWFRRFHSNNNSNDLILYRVYQDYLLMFKIPPEGSC